jgi:hypothetical protein
MYSEKLSAKQYEYTQSDTQPAQLSVMAEIGTLISIKVLSLLLIY